MKLKKFISLLMAMIFSLCTLSIVNASDEKPLHNFFTNGNNTNYNTKVAYPNACCASIDNGIVYYSLVYTPYIYGYDGTKTIEYNAGGSPSGIIAKDNKIYYLNEDNNTICTIDAITKERTILFARLTTISKFVIYGDNLYIFGSNEDGNYIYEINLQDHTATPIVYDNEYSIAYGTFVGNNLYYIKYKYTSEGLKRYSEYKVIAVDIDTYSSTDIYNISGEYRRSSSSLNAVNLSSFYPNSLTTFGSNGCVYIKTGYFIRETTSDTRVDSELYNKYDASTATLSETAEAEYNELLNMEGSYNGYVYSGSNSSIKRTNVITGIPETLVASSSSESYTYLACDGNIVVFWSGKVTYKLVASADQYSGAIYSCYSHRTDGYTEANIYVMKADGNDMQLINTYTKSGGTTAVTEEDCTTCGGDGRVTCIYCNGTGKGTPIYVMGQLVEQGCTYCGSSGWRVCDNCGGSGKVENVIEVSTEPTTQTTTESTTQTTTEPTTESTTEPATEPTSESTTEEPTYPPVVDPTVEPTTSQPLPEGVGDVNGDGNINFNDAILILRHSAGSGNLSDEQKIAADVNADGNINFNDAILVLKSAAA